MVRVSYNECDIANAINYTIYYQRRVLSCKLIIIVCVVIRNRWFIGIDLLYLMLHDSSKWQKLEVLVRQFDAPQNKLLKKFIIKMNGYKNVNINVE